MDINITEATRDDLPMVIHLGEQLQNESMEYEPRLIFNYDKSYKHYEGELSSENARIIIAVVDNAIVGYQYSFITTLDYLAQDARECTFEALYVVPEFRHCGVGAALMHDAESWATNTKCVNRIKASIYSANDLSRSMHEKDGFVAYCTEYIKFVNSNESQHACLNLNLLSKSTEH